MLNKFSRNNDDNDKDLNEFLNFDIKLICRRSSSELYFQKFFESLLLMNDLK